jgi:hypothetical protein
MQGLQAHVGCVGETGADGVEDTKRFDLSTVSLLVDDNGGIDVGAKVFPVADLNVDVFVLGRGFAPLALFNSKEAVLDAVLCFLEVEAHVLVRTLRAVLVDHTVAS